MATAHYLQFLARGGGGGGYNFVYTGIQLAAMCFEGVT